MDILNEVIRTCDRNLRSSLLLENDAAVVGHAFGIVLSYA